MESALYGIYALVVFVSEILLVRCAHSFDFWYVNNSCVNTVRQHFPRSILYFLLVSSSCKWTGRILDGHISAQYKKGFALFVMFFLSNCGLKIKNERPLLCVVSGSVNRQMHRLGEIEMTKMVNWIKWIRPSFTPIYIENHHRADQAAGPVGVWATGPLGVAGPWAGAGGRAPALAKPTSSTE